MGNWDVGFRILLCVVVALWAPLSVVRASDLDAATKHELAQFVKELMISHLVPSVSVAIVRPGEEIWTKVWGHQNLATQALANDQTVYGIASMLKPITATTLLSVLADETVGGVMDPDSDVRKLVPESIRPENPVSFQDVLSHHITTLGGPAGAKIGLWYWNGVGAAKFPIESLDFKRRDRSKYIGDHNSNYYLAGYLVASLAGEKSNEKWMATYRRQVHQRVIDQLGMNRTSFHPGHTMIERLAIPYSRADLYNRSLTPLRFHAVPAAEAYSTPSDLARFLAAHLNQGVLKGTDGISAKVVADSHQTPDPKSGIALGWKRWKPTGQDLLYHGGVGAGYSGMLMGDLKSRIGICIMVNCQTDTNYRLFKALKKMGRKLLLRLSGQGFAPEVSIRDFVGRFANADRVVDVVEWAPGEIGLQANNLDVPLESATEADRFTGLSDGQSVVVQFNRLAGLVSEFKWKGEVWKLTPFGPPPVSSDAELSKAIGKWRGLLASRYRTQRIDFEIRKKDAQFLATLRIEEQGDRPLAIQDLRLDAQGAFAAAVQAGEQVAYLRGRLDEKMIAGRFATGPYELTFVLWNDSDQPPLEPKGTWLRVEEPAITLELAGKQSVTAPAWKLDGAPLIQFERIGREIRFETVDAEHGRRRWSGVVMRNRIIGVVLGPDEKQHEFELVRKR
jgi:CubicO group peptidase (beta-lactamase class C family)